MLIYSHHMVILSGHFQTVYFGSWSRLDLCCIVRPGMLYYSAYLLFWLHISIVISF